MADGRRTSARRVSARNAPTPEQPKRSHKKKALLDSPAAVPEPKAKRPKSATPIPEPETLPTQVKDGEALPAYSEPQSLDLTSTEYKSIAESAVLQLSLAKSRQTWLADNFFEKYWVKTTKKNPDNTFNPGRETMTKLCSATMIIEPHVFEVTLHAVKGNQLTFLPPVGQKPMYAPPPGPIPYGSPYGNSFPQQSPLPMHQPAINPGSFRTPTRPHPPPPAQIPPSQPTPHAVPPSANAAPPAAPQPPASGTPGPITGPSPDTRPPDESTGTDPVIQKLAARAAEDPELKALMKIVAQGHASQAQLAIFQKHIDELNLMIQQQKKNAAAAAAAAGVSSNPSTPQAPPPHPPTPASAPPAPFLTPAPLPPRPLHPASALPMKQENLTYWQPPQYIKSKGPTPVKQDISAVIFEFVNAPYTRYFLPKNSILEYLPGNAALLMSFLVTRKGGEASGGKYDADKEYFQPVTLKLTVSPSDSKHLASVGRVMPPPDEVRKKMTETMEKAERANDAFLALRLPREEGVQLKKDVRREKETAENSDVPQESYEAPNSLLEL